MIRQNFGLLQLDTPVASKNKTLLMDHIRI